MRNDNGYYIRGLTPEKHLENVQNALKRGELEIALYDLRELRIWLEKQLEKQLEVNY